MFLNYLLIDDIHMSVQIGGTRGSKRSFLLCASVYTHLEKLLIICFSLIIKKNLKIVSALIFVLLCIITTKLTAKLSNLLNVLLFYRKNVFLTIYKFSQRGRG